MPKNVWRASILLLFAGAIFARAQAPWDPATETGHIRTAVVVVARSSNTTPAFGPLAAKTGALRAKTSFKVRATGAAALDGCLTHEPPHGFRFDCRPELARVPVDAACVHAARAPPLS